MYTILWVIFHLFLVFLYIWTFQKWCLLIIKYYEEKEL